jgi:hypothetical protein
VTCPLYVRGLSITPGPGPGEVDLRGDTPQAVKQIRERVLEEIPFQGAPTAPR